MKQKELRASVAKYLDEKMGTYLPLMSHNGKRLSIVVKYPTGSSSSLSEAIVDYMYIDNAKRRVFFVGKEDANYGLIASLLGKGPLSIKVKNFEAWANAATDKYDDYEVHFAWKYEQHYEDVYNYIPLVEKVEAYPNPAHASGMIFYADSDVSAFKFKAKNLNESLANLRKNHREEDLDQD